MRHTSSFHGITPKKWLGQNFLTDPSILKAMIETAAVSSGDTVLEIGPGLGALTRALAEKAESVVAVEKDRDLFDILSAELGQTRNLTLINQDILEVAPETILARPYKLVSNLPYSITSPVIRMFLEATTRPLLMALMVQKEVAKRICAKPPAMTLLAASVQYYASARVVRTVKKTAFWPIPNVDSAILLITPFPEAPAPQETEDFFRVARAGFLHPRKQIQNNIAEGLCLSKAVAESLLFNAGVKPTRRAATLEIPEWKTMAKIYKAR